MTIAEVKAAHKLTDDQVADAADKYLKSRGRARKQGESKRAEMKEFRAWKATAKK